ncbi:MAG: glycoside hydrolase family 88 protein [Lachnospiraceae bacterium]|nr:glycoside hydrolase family 88 protein [Lachnospiraceae bacterium]
MWVEEILEKLDHKLEAECGRMGHKIPYIAQDGHYQADMRDVNLSWWTNGFWAGMLWQMYHATGKDCYKTVAEYTEEALDGALENFEGLHHDVGFMWMLSAAADYGQTGNPAARRRALHAATLLAGRYNPDAQFIRAWNQDKTGWMIIDCMMNLSLLFWAARETGDVRFSKIACHHADTAARVLMREDGSCNHIAVLNPENGELLETPAGQGYAPGSSWSRGQAWAVYGFALAFRNSGNARYLDIAKRAAHYFIANVGMTGFVSLVDFRAPKEPVQWDTTATACAACGLLEIAGLVEEPEQELYAFYGEQILHALAKYHLDLEPERDGILQNGTAAYHREEDTQVRIIYGDYFFTEGILRLLNQQITIW